MEFHGKHLVWHRSANWEVLKYWRMPQTIWGFFVLYLDTTPHYGVNVGVSHWYAPNWIQGRLQLYNDSVIQIYTRGCANIYPPILCKSQVMRKMRKSIAANWLLAPSSWSNVIESKGSGSYNHLEIVWSHQWTVLTLQEHIWRIMITWMDEIKMSIILDQDTGR